MRPQDKPVATLSSSLGGTIISMTLPLNSNVAQVGAEILLAGGYLFLCEFVKTHSVPILGTDRIESFSFSKAVEKFSALRDIFICTGF